MITDTVSAPAHAVDDASATVEALNGPTNDGVRVYRRRIGPVLVLAPIGELDADSVTTLVTTLTTTFFRPLTATRRRAHTVVIDLSAVTFMDCATIGQLVFASHRGAEAGVRVRVAALPAHARRLFELFDLYPVLGGRHDVAVECHLALQHLAIDRGASLPAPA